MESGRSTPTSVCFITRGMRLRQPHTIGCCRLLHASPTSVTSVSRQLTSTQFKNKPRDTQKSQSSFSMHAATIFLLVVCLEGAASPHVGWAGSTSGEEPFWWHSRRGQERLRSIAVAARET